LNLFGLSPGELILILLVAMIVIGPEKLPETAASIGKWIREFRRVTTELTQQFAEDNPFTEIQRALSFTDEPAAPTAGYPPIETTPASNSVAAVESSSASVQPAPPAVSPPRRSDYFDRPSYYAAVEDSWTHGGLAGYAARMSKNGAALLPIADEWTHGVAVPPPPPVVEEVDTAVADEVATSPEAVVAPVEDGIVRAEDSVVGAAPVDGVMAESATGDGQAASREPSDEPSTVDVAVEPPTVTVESTEIHAQSNGVGHDLHHTTYEPVEGIPATTAVEAVGASVGASEERLP
jgi:sec-independent protein translocase protein TatB